MPTLDRNDVQIHYEVYGAGPAVLLTHGYSATCEMWKPQIDALSQRYRLVLWDMRGHGQSDSPDNPAEYSEEATIGDIAALLDASDTEEAVCGGLSLGGVYVACFPVGISPAGQEPDAF